MTSQTELRMSCCHQPAFCNLPCLSKWPLRPPSCTDQPIWKSFLNLFPLYSPCDLSAKSFISMFILHPESDHFSPSLPLASWSKPSLPLTLISTGASHYESVPPPCLFLPTFSFFWTQPSDFSQVWENHFYEALPCPALSPFPGSFPQPPWAPYSFLAMLDVPMGVCTFVFPVPEGFFPQIDAQHPSLALPALCTCPLLQKHLPDHTVKITTQFLGH